MSIPLRQAQCERTSGMCLREMNLADMDVIMRIEQSVHAHPWTRGNFTDALKSDCICKVYETEGEIVGYFVFMPALDEVQLLNISIAVGHQRKGLGRKLLEETMQIARGMSMRRMLLEVRASNVAALGLYRDAGYSQIGLRHGYYPSEAPARGTPVGSPLLCSDPSAGNRREDAVVMECEL